MKKAFSWLLVQGAINNAARGLCLRNSLSQLFFYFLHAAEAWGISVPQASAAAMRRADMAMGCFRADPASRAQCDDYVFDQSGRI
ncbi:MAG: hypothetical protein NTZ08_02805 [Verrucomicrobia bacterium]|nr:hypothetical protein [Verrucomicrobiota bacterium]